MQARARCRAHGDHHPAELFIEVLSTLVTQGKVKLLDVFETSAPIDSEMLGWLRDDMALLLPDAAYRRVAMFLGETGEHWAPSLRELHKELVARGYLAATADARESGQWRVGPERKKKRVAAAARGDRDLRSERLPGCLHQPPRAGGTRPAGRPRFS